MIFNQSFKELKPSKSVDLTSHTAADSTTIQNSLFLNDEGENFELFLFKPSERVE